MPLDLDKLQNSSSTHLLDVLLQCENVLDSVDLYCAKNWIDGEVVEGPIIRRHWVSISLLYPYHKMPDPKASLRLLKIGIKVEFNKVSRAENSKPSDLQAMNSQSGNNPPEVKTSEEKDWFIKLSFPRRLLDDIAAADNEMYEDEVDVDNVEDAKDAGINDESAYKTDENPDSQDSGTDADMEGEGDDGFPQ